MKRYLTRSLCLLLAVCLFAGMGLAARPTRADGAMNVLFHNMDTAARQDMEPSGNPNVKSLTLSSDCLEGSGSVRFGYKADKTGGLYWYFRVPEAYNTVGLDIAGATHILFDLYVSDVTGWTLSGDSRLALRSLASAQTTGTWDTSCGQVTSAVINETFQNLHNGWNRVVLPLDTSVATQTVIWGMRLFFADGSAKAGFYIQVDDIHFVNQAYLDSDAYADITAAKDVAMRIAALPAPADVTAVDATAVADVQAAYEALSAPRQALVANAARLQAVVQALGHLGDELDVQIDPLDTTARTIVPAGNVGTDYPKGAVTAASYTEGTGAHYSDWKAEEGQTLTGAKSGVNVSLVGVGGDSGLDLSAASYLAFDMFVHGFTLSDGGTAFVGFGSQASWSSADLGSVTFTEQMAAAHEGWNHFVLPIHVDATAVKNIRLALDQGCTAVTLTAEDPYVLLDDFRLLNAAGLATDRLRTAAKTVVAAIAEAKASGNREDVLVARAAYDALSAEEKPYVTNLALLDAMASAVVIPFRSLDTAVSVNGGNGTQERTASLNQYLEGAGAVKWTYTSASNGLFWYVYCDDHAGSTGVDIAGADYMLFDLYVSDASAWTLAGDTRINLRDTADGWNSRVGQVAAADMNAAFGSLKTGWNHLALPVDLSDGVTTKLWAFRMYFASGAAPAGFYTIMDDVRFVSAAYLQSEAYASTLAAKDVAAAIWGLSAQSTPDEIRAVQGRFDSLTEAEQALVPNADHLRELSSQADADPLNILFRDMDSSIRTAQEAATSPQNTVHRVQGTGATLYEHAVDRNGDLYWYAYTLDAGTSITVTGATYMIFDFYVSDPALWTIGETGGGGVGVRNAASATWDTSCTEVKGSDLRAAFRDLKQGWNHVVLPLGAIRTPDAWAFRIQLLNASAKQGFYTIIDDVRFVNGAYLNSEAYADTLAAKDVAAMIDGLSKDSPDADKAAARAAYNALTAAQKKQVPNLNWLTAFEQGRDAPTGTTAPTFRQVPANHLAERKIEESAFTLAFISDLHYAVNYDGAQQEIYYDSMRWLLQQAERETIPMAIQLGDMTSGNTLSQWRITRRGFDILRDGGLPFTAVIGNHDMGGARGIAYNAFVPYAEQVETNPYLAGAMIEGKSENLYYTMVQDGIPFLILTLTCYPKDAELNWADGVIKAHPDHNVILVTHSYLREQNGKVVYSQETEALAAGFNGRTVFDRVVRPNPNVKIVLCAHNSYKTNQVGLLTDVNDAGGTVYQFLVSDPQGYEATYGGVGHILLMRFQNGGTTLSCEYAASRYDKDMGTASNYTLSLDLIQPVGIPAGRVDAMIAALPDQPQLADEAAVMAARAAYEALTDEEKALVTGSDRLTEIETLLEAVLAIEKLRAIQLQQMLDDLPAPEALTPWDAAAVQAVRNQYENLPDRHKEWLSPDFADRLAAAEEAVAAAIADEEAVAPVRNMLDALPDPLTPENAAAVQAVRQAYDALTDWQKARLGTDFANRLAVAEAAVGLAPTPVYTPGDINGDGSVNAADALLALQHSVKLITLEDEKALAADVSGDGSINAADALLILQKSVKLIDKFPVEP